MGPISPVRVEAKFYVRENDGYRCLLCPHNCFIPIGGTGKCGSRKAEEDILVVSNYGRISFMCMDPIEKKPLFHFHPKSKIFSIGSIGCNMSCRHCQNYAISQSGAGKKRTTFKSPHEIVSMCKNEGSDAIAFTYNEPIIWYEYIMDIMECSPDLKCVLVSNGLCCEEPLRQLCKVADAFNIDIKGFDDDFYMSVCGGHLNDVLNSVKIIFEEGVHLELTYLIIPGYNDSEEEIVEFSKWVIDELSADVPVHFTRFHPDNEMDDVPWTPEDTMIKSREVAMKAGLNFVYLGNMMTDYGSDTFCPACGDDVIKRLGYLIDLNKLYGSRCVECGRDLKIIR